MTHDRYCFCTDCAERRDDTPEDFPVYDEWRKAFPELPWDDRFREACKPSDKVRKVRKWTP